MVDSSRTCTVIVDDTIATRHAQTTKTVAVQAGEMPSFEARRRTADRIFRAALIFNAGLTVFWLFVLLTNSQTIFFKGYEITAEALTRVGFGILFFYVIWGFIWYAAKTLL